MMTQLFGKVITAAVRSCFGSCHGTSRKNNPVISLFSMICNHSQILFDFFYGALCHNPDTQMFQFKKHCLQNSGSLSRVWVHISVSLSKNNSQFFKKIHSLAYRNCMKCRKYKIRLISPVSIFGILQIGNIALPVAS